MVVVTLPEKKVHILGWFKFNDKYREEKGKAIGQATTFRLFHYIRLNLDSDGCGPPSEVTLIDCKALHNTLSSLAKKKHFRVYSKPAKKSICCP